MRFNGDYSEMILGDLNFKCAVPWSEYEQRVCTHEYNYGATFIFGIETRKYIFMECSAASYSNNKTDSSSVYIGKCESFLAI